MKRRIQSFARSFVALIFLGVLILVPMQKAAAVTTQSLAVPAYEQPGKNSLWDDVRNAGAASVPFIVANPSNGPGGAAVPAYIDGMQKNTAAGIRTLGYVQTNYQGRHFKDVYNEIDAWYRIYPDTKGIYIDLVKEGAAEEVCYVAGLYSHIKNAYPKDLVVLGTGTHISPAYEPYGDIFANAISDYDTYKSWQTQFRGFEDKTSNQNRFWHIIYGVSSERYSSAFDDVRNNNAGWVYLTDRTAPTQFSATPGFWQNEASDVTALPESVLPDRGKTSLPRGCISLSASADSTVDTTTAKQGVTTSKVTASNNSNTYDSEPTTSVQLVTFPKGAKLTDMAAPGWSCNVGARTCTYNSTLAHSSSAPVLTVTVQTDCEYGGGDAKLRLTNYAGNRWDTKLPLRTPFGCDPGSPAGKLNRDASGQVITLTNQSVETTPEITPLGGTAVSAPAKKNETTQKSLTALQIFAVVLIIIILIGLGFWGAWILHKRQRYSIKM